jgi:alpha-tubulin suppressor-like RCC1 family protein
MPHAAPGTFVQWGSSLGADLVPEAVKSANVVEIGSGWRFVVARFDNGSIAAWGDPENQQLEVPPNLGPVTQIAVGKFHTVALLANGTVRQWGKADSFDGGSAAAAQPTDYLTGVLRVSAGDDSSFAYLPGGRVEGWGGGLGFLNKFTLSTLEGVQQVVTSRFNGHLILFENGTMLNYTTFGGSGFQGTTLTEGVASIEAGRQQPRLPPGAAPGTRSLGPQVRAPDPLLR